MATSSSPQATSSSPQATSSSPQTTSSSPQATSSSPQTTSSSSVIVAAIDFGTTFSTWGFSFKHTFEENPAKVETKHWTSDSAISLKGPTAILIHPDGERFHSFGYEAEDEYAELMDSDDHKNWYFFKHFKMKLNDDQGLTRNLLLKDISGKPLPASTVFGLSIQFLKDDLMETCRSRVSGMQDTDVNWVLTVPAIWTDAAKQFMREAAEGAGISKKKLTIALEPECASILCRHVPLVMGAAGESLEAFSAGSKYIIVDAGGGTVDLTVHEVTETGQLRELCIVSGGAWGGTRVDAAFLAFLEQLFGKSVMEIFHSKHLQDYSGVLREFELKKRTVGGSTNRAQVTIKLPPSLLMMYSKKRGNDFADDLSRSSRFASSVKLTGDKLKISSTIVKAFFKECIVGTKRAVSRLLAQPQVSDVRTLVLVGGLSESSVYRDAVKREFHTLGVVVPQDSGLAVLKGAVIYGHAPSTVCERVTRYTYGINLSHPYTEACNHPVGRREIDQNGQMRCYDIFTDCIRMGARMRVGTKSNPVRCSPIFDEQDRATLDIYASHGTPQFVTEPGCIRIGTITVYVKKRGRDQTFQVSMTLGGTEIEVAVSEESTGDVTGTTVNFLG